ncbi:testis-specific gene A8 protein-like [Schistocerca piceifrons]|uniref:testis-specific gene A8 protein-like n=1 Tax=Schistocerca piceifrons TaxID=274613 RepID=UPI001F5FC889|nr:testis-specific gene A8 protein-like [Schistocerca piceifrons]
MILKASDNQEVIAALPVPSLTQAEPEEMVTSKAAVEVEAAIVPTHNECCSSSTYHTHLQDSTAAEDEATSTSPQSPVATTVPTAAAAAAAAAAVVPTALHQQDSTAAEEEATTTSPQSPDATTVPPHTITAVPSILVIAASPTISSQEGKSRHTTVDVLPLQVKNFLVKGNKRQKSKR